MILIDTNVVSEAMKPEPHSSILDWLDAQAVETLFLSSVIIAELMFGIGKLPQRQVPRTISQPRSTARWSCSTRGSCPSIPRPPGPTPKQP